MIWKIPFLEYLQSDRTRVARISDELTKVPERSDPTDRPSETLSQVQLNVIKKFPSPLESSEKNYIKMRDLIELWSKSKDKLQIWPIAYNIRIFVAANSLSALLITHGFRRAFKLADGRTAVLNSYVPAMALPVFFGTILHYSMITAPITSGIEKCQICQCLTAGLIQATSAAIYPMIYSSVSSIYFADYFATFPTPDSIKDQTSRKYVYDVLLKAFRRNRLTIISVAILNFVFAYYMTYKERETIELMYFSLLDREFKKHNKIIK